MKYFLVNGSLALILLAAAVASHAKMIAKPVQWILDGRGYSGYLVYDDSSTAKRPGLLMVPNWYGVNAEAVAKARMIAGSKYVILLGGMFGRGIRPANAAAALAVLRAQEADAPPAVGSGIVRPGSEVGLVSQTFIQPPI